MTTLVRHEPIALPDVTRLRAIPPLPAWLATRQSKVSFEFELGSYRRGPTLPAELLLSTSERAVVESYLQALQALIAATPENDEDARKGLLATVTKMMLVLPSQKASEEAGEAKAEAFDVALSDVPVCAINEAVRGWYRGQYGDGHNYTWQPAPAVLRRLAFLELTKIRYRIRDLENILAAKAERDLPPPAERPTWADIQKKLPWLRRMFDAPTDVPCAPPRLTREELERRRAQEFLDRCEAEASARPADVTVDFDPNTLGA
jgi:hypothetical protein